MAINVEHDTLISLRQLPSFLQKRIGKRIHLSTIFRWRRRGIFGVQLECISIGRQTYTTLEAVIKFFEASTDARQNQPVRLTSAEKNALEARAKRFDAEAASLGI